MSHNLKIENGHKATEQWNNKLRKVTENHFTTEERPRSYPGMTGKRVAIQHKSKGRQGSLCPLRCAQACLLGFEGVCTHLRMSVGASSWHQVASFLLHSSRQSLFIWSLLIPASHLGLGIPSKPFECHDCRRPPYTCGALTWIWGSQFWSST